MNATVKCVGALVALVGMVAGCSSVTNLPTSTSAPAPSPIPIVTHPAVTADEDQVERLPECESLPDDPDPASGIPGLWSEKCVYGDDDWYFVISPDGTYDEMQPCPTEDSPWCVFDTHSESAFRFIVNYRTQ